MALPRHVVLGVTGGIAAYKAVYLLRLLMKSGCEVRVVMTPEAEQFVGRITFSALSGHEVLSEFTDASGRWNNHVHLAQWAELIIIAPATANTMAAMANGLCQNLLQAVCLSARCPIVIAPAMDRDMWKHKTTGDNVSRLKSLGYTVLPVGEGELASGLEGEGRMLEPEAIIEALDKVRPRGSKKNAKPLRVLITAGPTQEPIDAVRFISNRSTGKMGVALADAFAERGADVTLVIGPTALRPSLKSVKVTEVNTAQEMYKACIKVFPGSDIIIAAAAVADFKPVKASHRKLKKDTAPLTIALEPTADILEELGRLKKKKQMLVGFALETDNEISNARNKLSRKNLDLTILNSLNDTGAGFGHDTNKVTLLWPNNKVTKFGLMPKTELGHKISELIISNYA